MHLLRLATAAVLFCGALSAQTAATIAGCSSFPANSAFNTPIDTLPVHPRSANYIANIAATTGLRWDTTIPFNVVPGTQPMVPININWPDESDPGPYPIPPNPLIEAGSDRHVLVVDKDRCILYETFYSWPNADGSWTVDSSAKWNLLSNALRPAFWTSADAAGLPITPLLLRYEEILAGEIKHAIRFTAPRTQRLFVWPGRHYASANTDPNLPPMGQRFRLRADFDISGFSPTNQIILRAMKKYGLILSDNGLPWFFQLASDSRWDGEDLNNLRWYVLGSNFEAVDASSLMLDPDSGGAIQPGSPAALSSISLSPASLIGGNNVSVTVNLTAAATGLGAAVMLLGSDFAAFPTTSVTVSPGLLTQTFSVPTAVVSSSTPVTITAWYNGANRSASITVNPGGGAGPRVTGLSLSPSTVTGGSPTSATVTLSGAAPSGGLSVSLTSSNTAVVAASTLTVAAGLSSASFSVPTNSVASSTTVNLTASAGGGSASASLTVNPAAAGFTPIRVNAGGPAYTDSTGKVWSADTGFVGGYPFSTAATVGNTTTPTLYQTERFESGVLRYAFTVPNATYTVTLKFAEIYHTTCGRRIFNVAINGSTLETNFDPCAAAGGSFRAVDRTYTVNVTSGQINISLSSVLDNAKISAIEITSGAAPPPPPPTPGFTPIRVNAGGPAYTDPSGNTWSADTGFLEGYTFWNGASIANTTTPALYQTERFSLGVLRYAFAVPNATYTVTLKYAEIYHTTCGRRIFNVAINGSTLDANFDPCAAAGGSFRAVDRSYSVNVTSGQINISLSSVLDNPKISAIEITSGAAPPPPPPTPGFTPIRVNAGGPSYTDPSGNTWSADTGFLDGYTFSTGATIANTTTPVLYQTERFGSGVLRYAFTVPNATYTVTLKFAEIYHTTCGRRIFNVAINGSTVDANFDPCAAAGGSFRAVDRSYTVNVTSGQMNISLTAVLENPKISAIEIR